MLTYQEIESILLDLQREDNDVAVVINDWMDGLSDSKREEVAGSIEASLTQIVDRIKAHSANG